MLSLEFRPHWMRTVVYGVLTAGLLAGCGADEYEKRLLNTKDLFDYYAKQDKELQITWSRPELGISMRPPKNFMLLPAPVIPKPDEEGNVEIPPDTRQPAFLGVDLPGLVEAWQNQGVGTLYVCSNHRRFVSQTEEGALSEDPKTFFEDFEAAVQEALHFTISPEAAKSPTESNAKYAEKIPTVNTYALPKDFASINIAPGEIENVPPLSAQLYEHQAGPVQVAILCIFVKSTPTSPEKTLRMALETLQVSAQPPKGVSAGATGGNSGGAATGAAPTF
jgi:hypothetical protein